MEPHKEDVSAGIKLIVLLVIVLITFAIALAHADDRTVIDRREYIDAQY